MSRRYYGAIRELVMDGLCPDGLKDMGMFVGHPHCERYDGLLSIGIRARCGTQKYDSTLYHNRFDNSYAWADIQECIFLLWRRGGRERSVDLLVVSRYHDLDDSDVPGDEDNEDNYNDSIDKPNQSDIQHITGHLGARKRFQEGLKREIWGASRRRVQIWFCYTSCRPLYLELTGQRHSVLFGWQNNVRESVTDLYRSRVSMSTLQRQINRFLCCQYWKRYSFMHPPRSGYDCFKKSTY